MRARLSSKKRAIRLCYDFFNRRLAINSLVETGMTRSRSVISRPFTPHPGEVAEWPIAPVLKTGRGVSSSWVQIPPSPFRHSVTPGDRVSYLLSPLVFLATAFDVSVTELARLLQAEL